jgi:hypothetical protein
MNEQQATVFALLADCQGSDPAQTLTVDEKMELARERRRVWYVNVSEQICVFEQLGRRFHERPNVHVERPAADPSARVADGRPIASNDDVRFALYPSRSAPTALLRENQSNGGR